MHTADRRPHGQDYICPMCPEVREPAPGPSPSCGMALEPRTVAESAPNPELVDMTRRFQVEIPADPSAWGRVLSLRMGRLDRRKAGQPPRGNSIVSVSYLVPRPSLQSRRSPTLPNPQVDRAPLVSRTALHRSAGGQKLPSSRVLCER